MFDIFFFVTEEDSLFLSLLATSLALPPRTQHLTIQRARCPWSDLIYNLPIMHTYKSSFWEPLYLSGSVHTKLIHGAAEDIASFHAVATMAERLYFDWNIPLRGLSRLDEYYLDVEGHYRNRWTRKVED